MAQPSRVSEGALVGARRDVCGGERTQPSPNLNVRRAVVVGSAKCAPSDFARFALEGYSQRPHLVIAVNEAFRWLRRFDAWVTLHPEKMAKWYREAQFKGTNLTNVRIFVPLLDADDMANLASKGADPRLNLPNLNRIAWHSGDGLSGSSGMFGVRVAKNLSCDRILLAGVPMDTQPHVGSTDPWTGSSEFVAAWRAAEPKLKGKVKSMSGFTRELLGEPTLHWWGQ